MNPARLVVVVEDSSDCAETLQIALETLPGVEVRWCADARGFWGIPEFDLARVAAVVTDLHLAHSAPAPSDGYDVIRGLRADARFATIPILLITGDSDPRVKDLALACGASAWFPKPYSPSAVRRKLEELLC
jgi:DNA-binding response OmpR family regulator